MNILDGIYIFILGYTLIRGLYRGLVMECASIAGLILGFLAANAYSAQLSDILFQLTRFRYIHIVSYVLVFAAVLVGCVLLGSVLRKVLQVVMLLWLDRLGGGLLGFGKGLILSMLLLMILLFFFPSSSFVQQSKIVPYLHKITKTCILIMPEDIKESIFNK